ncbi:hypothetical protein CFBP4996_29030 (plasmid) [Agrobacterium leguminum]|uniref:hypothetical protein n=1 Tax=Agrobacterium TaxID=357 RepID=UPI0010C940AA|nr:MULTISPECIES: hypothetical protein [Agrobacterium]WFS69770.1 hypothetical protein CFBP4996_29030 [Agrobacterium leguminum]
MAIHGIEHLLHEQWFILPPSMDVYECEICRYLHKDHLLVMPTVPGLEAGDHLVAHPDDTFVRGLLHS